MISIDVENSSIYSTDNYILNNLTLETDSAEFSYRISLKKGYAGSSRNWYDANDERMVKTNTEHLTDLKPRIRI